MMAELNVPATAPAVAKHYGELLNGFVMDLADAEQASEIDVHTRVTETIMNSLQRRIELARFCVEFLYAL
jgi:LPPG:FO 2-phospho-L-lactate transferase